MSSKGHHVAPNEGRVTGVEVFNSSMKREAVDTSRNAIFIYYKEQSVRSKSCIAVSYRKSAKQTQAN
jgi:hypothetical protein